MLKTHCALYLASAECGLTCIDAGGQARTVALLSLTMLGLVFCYVRYGTIASGLAFLGQMLAA